MKSWKTMLCAAFLGAALASTGVAADQPLKGAHKMMNLDCAACHGNASVREVPQEEACFACHQSREAVQAKTASKKPNPHFGHDETVSCFECHKEHMESVTLCDNCHQFGFKTP